MVSNDLVRACVEVKLLRPGSSNGHFSADSHLGADRRRILPFCLPLTYAAGALPFLPCASIAWFTELFLARSQHISDISSKVSLFDPAYRLGLIFSIFGNSFSLI